MYKDLAQITAMVRQAGTFINLSPTAAIVIQDVTPDELSSSNFVLR